MNIRNILACAAMALPLLLGACASSPAQISASPAPTSGPKAFCLNFTSTKDVSQFNEDQEATYISCLADPALWAYSPRNAADAQRVLQQQMAIYAQAVKVYDANH